MSKENLGNRLEFSYGFGVRVNGEMSGSFPVYGSNGITGYIDNYKVKGPGIIIGRKGSVGKVSYSSSSFTPTDTAYYVRIKDHTTDDLKFWYYYLQLLGLDKLNTHSSVPGLSREVAYLLNVDPPSKSVQQKIAVVLSALDDKIELNNKINAELEAMAKTIYDYWFVQFDFPDKNGKPYKSSGGKMVYNEVLKREVPEGWEVKSIASITSLLSRGISPKYVESGGIPVLNQKCIRNKSIDFSLARRHDNESKKVESKLIYEGDILVNSTGVGTLGRVAIVKYLIEKIATVDSHVTILRIDNKKANQYYAGYAITEKQSEIEKLGDGSTGQTELSRDKLGSILLMLPKKETQKLFEEFMAPIFTKIATNEKQSQQLSELRDWLLPMLMNGQVTVGKAYEQVAEALSLAAEQ